MRSRAEGIMEREECGYVVKSMELREGINFYTDFHFLLGDDET